MANYLKATDFGAKDALISGDPNKIIKGTEINDEFDSIQTAVNSKANTNNAALTGTPTAPTASTGTATTQLATTAFVVNAIYPVGSIYISTSATNPSAILGVGVWEAFGAGKVLVGQDTGNTAFDTLEETGGSSTSGSTSISLTTGSTSLSVPRDGWGTSGGAPGAVTNGRLIVGSGQSEISEQLESIRGAGVDRSLGGHTHSVSGGEHTHTVQPPYVVVKMWKRTA